jgi:GT2 family glycosyltransferase
MTPVHNDGFESEDYHFCRRAREAGFTIIMDPAVRLGHYGQYRYGA